MTTPAELLKRACADLDEASKRRESADLAWRDQREATEHIVRDVLQGMDEDPELRRDLARDLYWNATEVRSSAIGEGLGVPGSQVYKVVGGAPAGTCPLHGDTDRRIESRSSRSTSCPKCQRESEADRSRRRQEWEEEQQARHARRLQLDGMTLEEFRATPEGAAVIRHALITEIRAGEFEPRVCLLCGRPHDLAAYARQGVHWSDLTRFGAPVFAMCDPCGERGELLRLGVA